MKMFLTLASGLVLSGLVLAQIQGETTGLLPTEPSNVPLGTRYVVEFSEAGSAKFRTRDGSMVHMTISCSRPSIY